MNTKLVKRILILAVVALAIILFFVFDLGQYLDLQYLRQSRDRFQDLHADNPALVLGVYFCIYVLVVALNLPGAVVMTLAGGALFGLWMGTLVVSFASTIGATLACFLARYVLRDWVQSRFKERLERVNRGVEREGTFYLFSMRLIPVIPFFVINLVMGLTPMRLWTFYWVSQLGMLPGTLVYVNAGSELGELESLSGVLSPGLILSFALLGIFPLAVKKLTNFIRRRTGRRTIDGDNSGEG